jgi:guanylate kinase
MKLIVISAPSGAGKTTLCQKLLADFPQLVLSISSTTRAPRGQEKHGVEYFFLTSEEFEKQIQAGRFAEWAKVHGNYYGTSKDVIEKASAEGKSVLLDIDVQGAASLRKAYPGQICCIFIAPPSLEELEQRLRSRGTDTEETIQKRLKNAQKEMSESKSFHHVIVNQDLQRAYSELRAIVARELSGGTRG